MKKKKTLLTTIIITLLLLATGCSETPALVTLGQYLDLEVAYTEKVVTDADVENAILEAVIAEQENVNITNRAVRLTDIANIDYSGKIDGELFDGGTDEGFDLEIGSGSFIEGFEDGVIGMKIGQTKDIKVTFPDPYQNNPDLSGVEAVFTVKVNSIEGKKIPSKITNAMIKEISDTYTTLSEFRKYIRLELEEEANQINQETKQEELWNIIVESSSVSNLSNKKIKYYSKIFESNYQYYAEMYGVDLTTFIQNYMGITVAEFNAEKKAYAEESAKRIAIIDAIADEQNISITDEEYQNYLEENDISDDEKNEYGESIKADVLFQKVMDFIITKTSFSVKK